MGAPSGNLRARGGKDGGGSVLGLFLLFNIAPIGGLAYAAYKWTRGELPLEKLPRGMGANVAALAAATALLFLFARWSLPAVHRAVRFAEQGFALRRRVMDRDAPGNPVRAVLALPFYAVLWIVAYPIRFVLLAASLALVGVAALGIVRLFVPEFGVEYGLPSFTIPQGK